MLYTGVTNNLGARVFQHKSDQIDGFTRRFRIHRLVYFETFNYVRSAIAREKEIKHWTRQRRIALIESVNPTWEDLATDWFASERLSNPKSLIVDSSSARTFSSPPEGKFQNPKVVAEPNLRIRFQPRKKQSFGKASESNAEEISKYIGSKSQNSRSPGPQNNGRSFVASFAADRGMTVPNSSFRLQRAVLLRSTVIPRFAAKM